MCLATVYDKTQEPDSIVLEFVSRIDVEGDTITLTDVMGETRAVQGIIRSVDLADSKVVIDCIE